jgi:hypothetical protein
VADEQGGTAAFEQQDRLSGGRERADATAAASAEPMTMT